VAFLVSLLAGLGSGLAGSASSAASSAATQATYTANEIELNASNARLDTHTTKISEATNTELCYVAEQEAHNHVTQAYIEAVNQRG
jgi:hypothetical protein